MTTHFAGLMQALSIESGGVKFLVKWWRHASVFSHVSKMQKSHIYPLFKYGLGFRFMVFNATFNNISAISWWFNFLDANSEN